MKIKLNIVLKVAIIIGILLTLISCSNHNDNSSGLISETKSNSIDVEDDWGEENYPEFDESTDSVDDIETNYLKVAPDFLVSESLINRAREQAIAQDYTPLANPAPFKILLIGYTNVSYGDVTYSMTEAQKKYLNSIAGNFKDSVEKAADYNVTIMIDVELCDSLLNIPTITSPDELIYIHQEYINDDLQRYGADDQYDSVLTTSAMPDSLAILGIKTAGVDNNFGYSYFVLGNPTDIPNTSEPTALATLIAIHEWLHQLEGYRELLKIDFPDIHAYLGANADPEYINYEKYSPDTVGDWWYFYRDVLGGKILYKNQKYIGMFPLMWCVTPRSLDKRLTIRNVASDQYLAVTNESILQVSSPTNKEAQWRLINYDGYVRLVPVGLSGWCLDVNNARASAGNEVKLFTNWDNTVEYINAQLWSIIPNDDGTFLICSKLDKALALSLDIHNDTVLTLESANGSAQQSWIIEPVD